MVLREYAEFASAASAEGNNQYAYPPPLLTKVTLRSFDRTLPESLTRSHVAYSIRRSSTCGRWVS